MHDFKKYFLLSSLLCFLGVPSDLSPEHYKTIPDL